MAVQPPPDPAPQVLPWLAQPLTPLLWPALGLAAVALVVSLVRVRRSSDAFPGSPRSIATAAVIICGLLGAMAFGPGLIHPAALIAAPMFLLAGLLVTWAGWHASDERQARGTVAVGLSAASLVSTGTLLLLFHNGDRWHMGLGVGESLSCFLPVLGVPLLPLAFLSHGHPRTPPARRAAFAFAGLLTLMFVATVAGAAIVTATPLAFDAPLADRYIRLSTAAAIPALVSSLCAAVAAFWPAAAGRTLDARDRRAWPVTAALCTLLVLPLAAIVEVRSNLTFQATAYSRKFHYNSLVNAPDSFRREAVGHPHALHMGGARWAWTLPQCTWWTSDCAWRDGLIVTDRSSPIPPDPQVTGPYYGAVIAGPDGKPSDVDFSNARYIAVVQPTYNGVSPMVVRTATARMASPAQLASWAKVSPTNPLAWLGLLLGFPLGWWLTHPLRTFAAAASASAGAHVLAALALGLGGVSGLLIGSALFIAVVSTLRQDQWRSPISLATLTGVAMFLAPLLIRLGDR